MIASANEPLPSSEAGFANDSAAASTEPKSAGGGSLKDSRVDASGDLLSPEAALVARLVRVGTTERQLLGWLHDPAGGSVEAPHNKALANALDQLLDPMLANASATERTHLTFAAEGLAVTFEHIVDIAGQLNLSVAPRMIAASLLPLYRNLAVERSLEAFRESRRCLSEMLCGLFIARILTPELAPIVQLHSMAGKPLPHLLKEKLDLDLQLIAELGRKTAAGCAEAGDFHPRCIALLWDTDAHHAASYIPDWAEHELLWRIAGELLNGRQEVILPRPWIDAPIPWASIAQHWSNLERLLQGSAKEQSTSLNAISPVKPVESKVGQAGLESNSSVPSEGESTSYEDASQTDALSAHKPGEMVTLDANLKSAVDAGSAEKPATETRTNSTQDSTRMREGPCTAGNSTTGPQGDNSLNSNANVEDIAGTENRYSHNDHGDSLTEDALSSEPVPHAGAEDADSEVDAEPTGETQSEVDEDTADAAALPPMMLAEIISHNDPALIKILNRQITRARQERRSLTLIALVVEAEDADEQLRLLGRDDSGLAIWQQKLLVQLVEHPDFGDMQGFVTGEGELVLLAMDVERSEAANGLRECLTSLAEQPSSESSLAMVEVMTKFHAGIATNCSPGPGFSAEQLVEPTWRCLSAAQRQGRGCIKTIEVF